MGINQTPTNSGRDTQKHTAAARVGINPTLTVTECCKSLIISGLHIAHKCSEPEDDLLQIYDTLKVDHIPIKARKFVWTQNADIKKSESWESGG